MQKTAPCEETVDCTLECQRTNAGNSLVMAVAALLSLNGLLSGAHDHGSGDAMTRHLRLARREHRVVLLIAFDLRLGERDERVGHVLLTTDERSATPLTCAG